MPTETNTGQTTEFNALREGLAAKTGPAYWRTLEELSGSKEFDAFIHQEFPEHVNDTLDPVSRRNFFKVMGASMMLAGLSSCARQPDEKIVPYVKPPEEAIAGKPMYFATAMPLAGYGIGLVATSYEGRPTKVEGLKEHPSSLGATDIYSQASILDLYNPDRLDTLLQSGKISTWNKFKAELATLMARLDSQDGHGIRILTGTVTSPTLGWQLDQLRALYPGIQWHQFDPASRNNAKAGSKLAYGKHVDTLYDFSQASVVLSLDADFMTEGPGRVRYSKDFARSRDYDHNGHSLSRLYVAESTPTLTGSSADHRLSVRYPDVETLARAVAGGVGVPNVEVDESAKGAINEKWLSAVIEDLKSHAGKSIVVAGEYQSPVVHALALAINDALNNTGATVKHVQPVEYEAIDQIASLSELVQDMNAGNVEALLVLGGNPVYNAPADLDFGAAMDNVPLRVHVTDIINETSHQSHWLVPEAHYLEAWGDVRGHDGTTSIVQPLILPLYNGKAHTEVVALLLGDENLDSYGIVRNAWLAKRGPDGFDTFWKKILATGIVENTASSAVTVAHKNTFSKHEYIAKSGQVDLVFRPDNTVYDGRFANNGWLQELPKPLTKLTWDNAVFLNPATASSLGLKHEDVVEVTLQERSVRAAIMIHFGQPADVATLHTGYGRTVGGKVGTGQGFNAYALQTSTSPWFASGASIKKIGGSYLLSHTGEHWHIEQSIVEQSEKAEERHLIREATLADYVAHPDFAQHMGHHSPERDITLYNPDEKKFQNGETPYNWGMTIDLNKCNGCNVCAIACQAENNIPIVGKTEVNNGREMHWIRIDRYYRGGWDNPEAVHQPIPCMHCENAPCEPVCPVGATSHSNEGLNEMTYNRCVGTRYCANNCPYKVRRFNFFHYKIREGQDAPELKMLHNPNVTVRSRGVMEKCTYCVQRINIARIDAKREGREIKDGEIITACQAACPSEAIVFGNIYDENSAVSKSKASQRNYALIGEIGTRPRTTYLAKLRNPNDSYKAGGGQTEHSAEH